MTKFILALIAGTVVCSATSITYNVNQNLGMGSVAGFIETNGATGVLDTADILNWDLVLNDGMFKFTLEGPLSGSNSHIEVEGTDLTATSTQLLFNYSDTAEGFVLFQAPTIGSMQDFWCPADADRTNSCAFDPGGEALKVTGFEQFKAQTGTNVIATVGGASSVPEPSSVLFAVAGLFGILLAGRRSVKKPV